MPEQEEKVAKHFTLKKVFSANLPCTLLVCLLDMLDTDSSASRYQEKPHINVLAMF